MFLLALLGGLAVLLERNATIRARNRAIAAAADSLAAEKRRVEAARAHAEQRGAAAEQALDRLLAALDAELLRRDSPSTRALAEAVLPVAIEGYRGLRDADYAHARADIGTAAGHVLLASLLETAGGDFGAARAELDAAEALLRARIDEPQAGAQLGVTLLERANLLLRSGQPAAAIPDAREALRWLRSAKSQADARLALASAYREEGALGAAREELERGLALVRGEARDPLLLALAQIARELGDLDATAALLEECVARQAPLFAAAPLDTGRGWLLSSAWLERARCQEALGDAEAARAALETCLALRRELAEAQPDGARAQQLLAQAEAALARLLGDRDPARAAALLHEAVRRQRRLVERAPEAPSTLVQLAWYLELGGRLAERQGAPAAEPSYAEALAALRELPDPEPAPLARVLSGLARVRLARGAPAEELLREAEALWAALCVAAPEDPHRRGEHAEVLGRLGALALEAGRREEARRLLTAALEGCRALRAAGAAEPPAISSLELTEECARLALEAGEPAAALAIYRDAAALARELAPEGAEHALWLRRCGELERHLGEPAAALASLEASSALFAALVAGGPPAEVEPELVELIELAGTRALLLAARGRGDEARAVLAEADALLDERRGRLVHEAALREFLAGVRQRLE